MSKKPKRRQRVTADVGSPELVRKRLELVGLDGNPALAENVAGILHARGIIDRPQYDAALIWQRVCYGVVGRPFARAVSLEKLMVNDFGEGREPRREQTQDDDDLDVSRLSAFRGSCRVVQDCGDDVFRECWGAFVLQKMPAWFARFLERGEAEMYDEVMRVRMGSRELAKFFRTEKRR